MAACSPDSPRVPLPRFPDSGSGNNNAPITQMLRTKQDEGRKHSRGTPGRHPVNSPLETSSSYIIQKTMHIN